MIIKERAYKAIGHPLPKKGEMHVPIMLKLEEQTFVNGYIQGATEQNHIDIDKTCEWLSSNFFKDCGETMKLYWVDKFRKAIKCNI